jgi:mono/diheme cytochrome c family protein
MARLWTHLVVPAVFVGATAMLPAAAGLTASTGPAPAPSPVTFSETVAPILYSNCVTCHRPGQAAPFSLITYEDAKKKAKLIAKVTESRYMPPWHAAHGYGEFADERRLTDQQIATIGEWVAQGMPQGDPAKMPKMPQFPEGWHLGTPDLVLQMPAGYELPASGPDIYRNFVIPTGLTEDKWVRAVEFRPSARKAVHHVLFAWDSTGASAKRSGRDGRPGFNGMGTAGIVGGGGGPLGGWAVGATPVFMPDGVALPLPKGSDLVLQMHFHLTGKVETEQATVGIFFTDKAPERKLWAIQVPALFGFGAGIDIPAGEKNYVIEDSLTLPVDMKAFSVGAHAHYIAKEMKATAFLPDGTTQPLLWIKDWDFNWQDRYVYKAPVVLPKGTRIDVRLVYDNSADNPHNPNPETPKRVLWGEQSFDEMGAVALAMQTLQKEDEPALQKVMAARVQAAIGRAGVNGTLQRFLASGRGGSQR